jgi:hypothetical protein
MLDCDKTTKDKAQDANELWFNFYEIFIWAASLMLR